MDFSLAEEQRAFRETARQFAAERLAPHAAEWDENSVFPVETLRAAAALGFGGIYVRDDVGGSALGRLDAALIRSAEPTSELQSLMRISYAVFCLKNKTN